MKILKREKTENIAKLTCTKNFGRRRYSAFTLPDGTPCFENFKRITRRAAFTLPEVLIVIGIIGVVAAVLMPTVIREFELRSNSYREANIANKVTQAMVL